MARVMIVFEDNPDGSCAPKIAVPKGDPQEIPAEWKDRTVAQSLAIMAYEYLVHLRQEAEGEKNATQAANEILESIKKHSGDRQIRPGHGNGEATPIV